MTIDLKILGIRLFTLTVSRDDEPEQEFVDNTDGDFELYEDLPFGFAPTDEHDVDFDDD